MKRAIVRSEVRRLEPVIFLMDRFCMVVAFRVNSQLGSRLVSSVMIERVKGLLPASVIFLFLCIFVAF